MTPAASPRTQRPITPFKLTPTDKELLLACARYQSMTVEHWVRWFEDDGKRRSLQRPSEALAKNTQLIPHYLTPLSGRGKGQNIFTHRSARREFAQLLGKRCSS